MTTMTTRQLAKVLLIAISALFTLISNRAIAEDLFKEEAFKSFVSDKRAMQIGDSVTLFIIESSQASSGSDNAASRDYRLSANAQLNTDSDSGSLGLGLNRDNGESTRRSGNLKATMTVSVTGIDSVGRLELNGEQRIIVNGEKQIIKVSGWVRRVDISAQNTVLSTRLTDASIEYNGLNVDGTGKKRNWFYRTLNAIGVI